MRLSDKEFDAFSDVVGIIYDTIVDERLWPRVLQTICTQVGGRASRIYWRDASVGKGETMHSFGFDPQFLKAYRETFVTLNPLYPASIFIKPGEVFSSRDLIPSDEFQSSRFFREWAEPQGFLDAAIFNIQRYQASAAAFTIIVGPDYGLVDERLRHRLRMLAPHLQRAALIRRELDAGERHTVQLEAVLNQIEAAVFILDPGGRTVWANRPADILLGKGDIVRNGPGGLTLIGPGADRQLREALSSTDDPTGAGFLGRPTLIRLTDAEGGEWNACLMRLQPQSKTQAAFERVHRSAQMALFLRRTEAVPALAVEVAAAHYGLTPAEVRTLQRALEIDTVSSIAASLGISANTVKKHLSSIFGKMGVTRRAGLIKAVLSAANGH